MAGLLADGLNLGLTRMAEACTIASLGQLAWVADWHIRDETYALALQRLVDHQQREPLAALFGGGFASSSDGQFFRAGGFGRDAGHVNAHYGDIPGSKFYTHVSDRYAAFHTKVIAATASEALHVCCITRAMLRSDATTPTAAAIQITSLRSLPCSALRSRHASRT
jgi:TnpA family transposase